MPSGYYRFPTIHENTVVFACEDDLWTVPSEGGVARRLTSNLGEASRPWLSPDGTKLAFVGRDEGESEIYVMPTMGGTAKRLTFMGGLICTTAGWTPDGKILFANNGEHWYLRFLQMYKLDPDGGTPERYNWGPVRAISYGKNGGVVIGRHTDEPARWKRYRGGTAGHLWIDRDGSGTFEHLIDLNGNLASPLWIGERIYFISDHEGISNLYSCTPMGEDLQRHTDHEDYYARNATSDGNRIVYHAGADLYLYDPSTDSSTSIDVEFYSPQVQRKRKFVNTTKYLQEYNLHPKGQHLALSARGKMVSFANWEGAVIQHGSTENNSTKNEPPTGVRYRLPRWLNDGKRLIAVTDDGGEERFVIFNADGTGEPILLPDLDIGRPEAVKVNPKVDQIIFSNHRYEILFLDLESNDLQVLDRGKSNPISGFDWSPDGEWVAYSVSISMQTIALKLWNVSEGTTYPLTDPVLRDVDPVFDPNGKYIYFLSYRTYDPVYDNMQFDLGFPLGVKPYLITLQKDLLSPFVPIPKVDEDKDKDDEDADDSAAEKQAEESRSQGADTTEDNDENEADQNGEEQEDEKTQIDLDGIERRIIAFPVPEGKYGQVMGTKDGKMLYTRFPPEGALGQVFLEEDLTPKGSLYLYNLDEQKEELLVKGVSAIHLSADGETLIYRAGKRLRVIEAGEKPPENDTKTNRKSGWINLTRVKVSVNPGSEWRQMFREAWRLQRDQFWTPDMSKIDWLAIHDRYLPLVDRVSSRAEFSDLMWEMQGELGTSHCYEFGGDYRPEPVYKQGYLGAEYEYDAENDGWRVTNILRGDGWDPKSDSPLANPGVNVQIGDTLLAINGLRLSQTVPPAAALVNLAGEEVTINLHPAPGEDESEPAEARSITVKTLASEIPVRYREWVENNRRFVHEATDGRVGYVHIPDMSAPGYAEFHRGFLAEVDRQGLIVDVRYNRGGHVSALLLQKLARKRIGYDTSRWSEIPYPYPAESVMGPMVALTNENAGSDGDIFSHGFKMMGLGPLIGKRTWGGVVGIWPRHTLVDGTITTQPEFSFWFYDVGWGVENYGTDPDIEVEITPQDYAQDVDPQMDRGLLEIHKAMEENPPEFPDFTKKPSLELPKLPAR